MLKEKFYNFYQKVNNFLLKNVFLFILMCILLLRSNINIPSPHNLAMNNVYARSNMKGIATNDSFEKPVMLMANINNNAGSKGQKITKNTSLTIEVKNVDSTKGELNKIIKDFKAATDNFYSYDYYNKKALNFSIKVPVEKLDTFLLTIKKNNFIKHESFSTQDKTELYNDNSNRLKNLYLRRNSLRKMLETKTDKLGDILAIDKELNTVQYEIERFEKANDSIQKTADFANVNLTVLPKVVIENYEQNNWNVKKSFANGINTAIKIGQFIFDYLVILLIFSPLLLIFYALYKKYFCKKIK